MSGIVTLVTGILLSLTFAWYRRRHAVHINELRRKYNFAELNRKYRLLHAVGTLALIFVVLPASLAGAYYFGSLGYTIAEQWYWSSPDAKFVLAPSWIAMYFSLGFLTFLA